MEVLMLTILLVWCEVPPPTAAADLGHVHAFLECSNKQLRQRYRPDYHISAPVGLLNDPAAIIFFRKKYHIFYQYHSYDGEWSPAAWGHAASADLVHWAHYPPVLLPHETYDTRGCLAGSAVRHKGYLALFYTSQSFRNNATSQTQSVAVSSDGIIFQKYLYNPVVRQMPANAFDSRNPKVWHHLNKWHMLVGASIAKQGHLLLYNSPDLYQWRLNGTVARSLGDMGYLWESPDLFELDGLCVLMLSAHGIHVDGDRFNNLQQSGYVIGRFDCFTPNFDELEVSTATFEELDRGHDFYAPKTIRAVDGRRLLVAWLGTWGSRFEEPHDGWAGVLTIVRELRLGKNGRILQNPVQEVTKLRQELVENAWYLPGEAFEVGIASFELIVNATSTDYDAELSFEWQGERQYSITYYATRGIIFVNRGGVDGVRRADWSPSGPLYWRIFVDRSSVEVFCGVGDIVFSSRILPRGVMKVRVGAQSELQITQYRFKRSIGYDNKLSKYLKKHVLKKKRTEPTLNLSEFN